MTLEDPPEPPVSLPANAKGRVHKSTRSHGKEKIKYHKSKSTGEPTPTMTIHTHMKQRRSKFRLSHPRLSLHKKTKKRTKLKRTASNDSLHQSPALQISREKAAEEIKDEKDGKRKRFSQASNKSTSSKRHSKSISATTGSSTQFSELDADATFCQRLLYKQNFLTASKLGAILVGLVIGYILKRKYPPEVWTERNISYVRYPAEIFYNIATGLKTPILITSIIAGVGSLNLKTFRYMAVRAFIWLLGGYYLVALVVSLLTLPVALLLRDTYHRPTGNAPNLPNCNSTLVSAAVPCVSQSYYKPPGAFDYSCFTTENQFMDLFKDLLPPNVVAANLESISTYSDLQNPEDRTRPTYTSCANFHATPNHDGLDTFHVSQKWPKITNAHGMMVVAIAAAACSIIIGEPAQPFVDFFISLSEIHLKIGIWTLWISPIGICSAVAAQVLENESPWNYSSSISWFLLFSTLLVIIIIFIFFPLLYYIFIRKLPFKFFLSLLPIMATAFGTASSTATLPLTIYGLEQFSHLDPRVVRFAIPLMTQGSWVGTTILHAACFIYCVIIHGASLDFGRILSISTSISLTQFHIANKLLLDEPSFLIASLAVQKFNTNYATSILPILWIFDRVSTVSGVVSDCVCCAIINHLARRRLHELAERDEKALKEMELAARNERWDHGYTTKQ